MLRPPTRSPLFPYTTLFRSLRPVGAERRSRDQLGGPADGPARVAGALRIEIDEDRKSTRLNSSHSSISYAVFCLKKKILIIQELLLFVYDLNRSGLLADN